VYKNRRGDGRAGELHKKTNDVIYHSADKKITGPGEGKAGDKKNARGGFSRIKKKIVVANQRCVA